MDHACVRYRIDERGTKFAGRFRRWFFNRVIKALDRRPGPQLVQAVMRSPPICYPAAVMATVAISHKP
jgi:hypothetical protein